MNCLFCHNPIIKGKFCNRTCFGSYSASHGKRNAIDAQLALVASYTDGQMPYGVLTQIAKMIGISKERVRQRAAALGYLSLRTIIAQGRQCKGCDVVLQGDIKNKKFHSPECRYQYMVAHRKVKTQNCEICHKDFSFYKTQRRRFCSRHCRSVFSGRKNNLYRYRISLLPKGTILVKEYAYLFSIHPATAGMQLNNAATEDLVTPAGKGVFIVK